MLITLYNERELFSFSNRVGLIYIKGLGNVKSERFELSSDEIEIGSRVFRVRKSSLSDIASSLERGPQIIVPKDIAYIGFQLDLPFADSLLEIGGGNGGFSILSSIMFKLKVTSYEQDSDIYVLLRKNLRRFEMEEKVEAINANGLEADINEYDCVFIDNPDPTVFFHDDKGRTMNVASILPTYSQAEQFSRFLIKKSFLVGVHQLVDVPIKLSKVGMRPETTFLYHTGFIVSGKRW